MTDPRQKGWLARRIQEGLQRGLTRAYWTVAVDPADYLNHLRNVHNLPVAGYQGLYSLPIGQLDDIAHDAIRASMKLAAAEGAGFGVGGFLTIVPDLSLLAAITIRMIQKLSLVYGFEFNTGDEVAELWIAAASAAGVDISRELLEREVVPRLIPGVIHRIAARASVEVVEKWAARIIPLASAVVGGGLNYYFVRTWGNRAASHFREKHLQRREAMRLPHQLEVQAL
jgi:EcsC protein family